MNTKNNFMLRAIELSMNSANNDGGPFGCVITKENEIIAEGSNKVTLSNDPTAHAEVVAIREACKKLNTFKLTGCDLYTSCEPCPMCLAAIYWSHIDSIFYAIKDAVASAGEYKVIPKLDAPATPEKILMSLNELKNRIRYSS